MGKKYQLLYMGKVFFETDEHKLMYHFMDSVSIINNELLLDMLFYVDGTLTAKTPFIWNAKSFYG